MIIQDSLLTMQTDNGTPHLVAVSLVGRISVRLRLAVSCLRMRIVRHRTRIRITVLGLPSVAKYQSLNKKSKNMKQKNNKAKKRSAWRSEKTARSPA